MNFKIFAFALTLAVSIGAAAPAAFAGQVNEAASQAGNSNAP